MKSTKYVIGEVVKDTDAFGDVVIEDILFSPTTSQYCYAVKVDNNIMLCFEGELNKDIWSAK